MSKITNVRLPSPSQEYNVQQQNELVRAIETIVFLSAMGRKLVTD